MENETPIEGDLIPRGIPATERNLIDLGCDIGNVLADMKPITSTDDLANAGTALQECSAHIKMLEKHRKDFLAPVRDFVTKVNAEYKVAADALEQGIRHAKSEVSVYQQKVAEEQRKAAEEEAARIQRNAEKRAETQRKKEEAAQKAAEEAAEAAKAATSAADKQAAEEAAEAAEEEAAYRAEEAERIRQEAEREAEHAKAAKATAAAPKAKGVSSRKNWKVEVTDLLAFAKAVVSGTDPRLNIKMLVASKPELNKLVKSQEGGCADIPGLNPYHEDVVSVRSSKK